MERKRKKKEEEDTLERRAAGALLQEPLAVEAGGRRWSVARPTLATLAEVSALASAIPPPGRLAAEDIVPYVLSTARRDAPVLARVAATLIVGAAPPGWRRWWRRLRVARVARELLGAASAEEVDTLVTRALGHQRIGFFLAAIISLGGANELRARKEAAATAPGE